MTDPRDRAKDIYQRLLDDIGAAHTSADFEAFARCFVLPHSIETFEQRTIVETLDQLRTAFDTVRGHLDRAGVTSINRICTLAEFVDAETIQAGHDSWLITSTHLIRDHYSALTTLRLSDGTWRVKSGQYAANGKSMPVELVDRLTARFPGRAVMSADTPIGDPAE